MFRPLVIICPWFFVTFHPVLLLTAPPTVASRFYMDLLQDGMDLIPLGKAEYLYSPHLKTLLTTEVVSIVAAITSGGVVCDRNREMTFCRVLRGTK